MVINIYFIYYDYDVLIINL